MGGPLFVIRILKYKTTLRCFVFSFIFILIGQANLVLAAPSESSRRNAPIAYLSDKKGKLNLPVNLGRTYPLPELERLRLKLSPDGDLQLNTVPTFSTKFGEQYAALSQVGDYVFLSVDPRLQEFSERALKSVSSPYVALVAVDPRSGKILAMTERAPNNESLLNHARFPAASLFKVVTSAAALEQGELEPDTMIPFRGGVYTLNQWNYRPNLRLDKRRLSVSEALGRSCNPVFGRIALKYLSPHILNSYALNFGFNTDLQSDLPLPESDAEIPVDDYGLSRTAAGFGDVYISPIHAASLMAGIANGGLLSRPYILEKIVNQDGFTFYQAHKRTVKRMMDPETAATLLSMMESTTTVGTSRKEFYRGSRPVLPGISVAAKTGTLRGQDPVGINNWFIAAAPLENPEIALAVVVVNPTISTSKASRIGRMVIQEYLQRRT